jgi:altronate dehydratase
MNNNPSPGNKVGGLSTILEKSLGAVAKAGTSPLNDVIEYAQPVTERGLVFMDRPGFDPCSVTAQVASGANVVAFTTGRGSAFGYKPSPSIKLSSNSETYARMKDDIDIDCGTIATGETRHRTKGRGDSRLSPQGRVGTQKQERTARLWRRRIHTLAHWRGDVAVLGAC